MPQPDFAMPEACNERQMRRQFQGASGGYSVPRAANLLASTTDRLTVTSLLPYIQLSYFSSR